MAMYCKIRIEILEKSSQQLNRNNRLIEKDTTFFVFFELLITLLCIYHSKNLAVNKLCILLISIITTFSFNSAFSQIGQRQTITDTDEEVSTILQKVWYGGNVSLGLTGSGNYTHFFIGISPMVGYKFTDWLSVGPRLSLEFNHFKFAYSNNTVEKFGIFTDTYAGFARAKIFRGVFGHLEYGITSIPVDDYSQGRRRILKEYYEQAQVGIGYNAGYEKFSSEIMLLYNLSNNKLSYYDPFEIRFGITYNY